MIPDLLKDLEDKMKKALESTRHELRSFARAAPTPAF